MLKKYIPIFISSIVLACSSVVTAAEESFISQERSLSPLGFDFYRAEISPDVGSRNRVVIPGSRGAITVIVR